MYHSIEFRLPFTADLEISPKHRVERLLIRKGMQVRAELHARVVEMADGPVEVADVYFEDRTVTRSVPYERFRFVE
jgi:hypothetical protein